MASRFDLALQAGASAIRRVAGQSVSVSDGTTAVTVSKAVQGESLFELDNGEQIPISWDGVDWLIEATKLTQGAPAEGWTITDGHGDVYTVCAPGGLKPVQWHDRATKTTYRIHAKKTG